MEKEFKLYRRFEFWIGVLGIIVAMTGAFFTVKSEISSLRNDIEGARSEREDMRQSIRNLSEDVTEIKISVNSMGKDISWLVKVFTTPDNTQYGG